jgi:hypothetical protein
MEMFMLTEHYDQTFISNFLDDKYLTKHNENYFPITFLYSSCCTLASQQFMCLYLQ